MTKTNSRSPLASSSRFAGRALMLSVAAFAVFSLPTLSLPARAQDAADLMLRLDRLEGENRRLTGQLEEMRFKQQRLEDQLKRFQSDADTRFRDLEGGKGGGGGGGSFSGGASGGAPANGGGAPRVIPTTPGPTAPAGKRSDAFDPGANPAAPGAPRPLGGAPAGPVPGMNPSGDIGAPTDLTGRGGNPMGTPGTDAKSNFDYARGLIERGDYENGEIAMRDFQKKFGKDKRAPEATYWIGESFLRRTRYREAAENFLTVTTKHSGIGRAPEAMLKLGISLRGLGANSEACGTFDQVGKKYPNASPAIKAAVEREKARAKCS